MSNGLSREEYERNRARILGEIKELEYKESEYRERNKIEFFVPLPHQAKALGLINSGKKIVLLQGGNQIGKTVFGACYVGACCLGIQPWDKQPTVFGDTAVKARVICEDWEKHAKEVIVPKLKEWLPVGQYETQKNNVGVDAFWTFRNGSTIEIMTNMQDTRLHESWTGHLVWADEPTSRDKYLANRRGLIKNRGLFLMTMTAVKESWVLDDIVLKQAENSAIGCITQVPMSSNPHLSEEAVKEFEDDCKEDEKLARVQGGWLNLVGLIWKGFNPDDHIIDSFKVPTDWPVVAMIDFHTALPHAIGYYAVSPQGVWHVIDEEWLNGSAKDVADSIIRKKKGAETCWRIENAFIDPLSKGDGEYIKRLGVPIDDSFTTIKNKLAGANIRLQVASKDKQSGIKNVESLLRGPNRKPNLFFCRNIVNKFKDEGHIYEIQRWSYDDNQEPRKEKDHFMENLYRLTLTGITYRPPVNELPATADVQYNPMSYGLEQIAV